MPNSGRPEKRPGASADSITPAPPADQRILVVDDEPDIVALVTYHLAKAGYRITTAVTGREALSAATEDHPALIVLDLMLPEMSGFDVLAQLRASEATRDIAVLLLTARSSDAERVRGLALGADDYLTKPFHPPELVLRVSAILRRTAPALAARADLLDVGPIRIDRGSLVVTVDGRVVELTATEYKLLLALAERQGRVQGRSHLLQTVWDAAPGVQTRTVDMHMQRLRAKLGPAGELIETVRGFGYRVRPAPQTRPRRETMR
ncbi:MAG: response regulator transcription factor [Gemmatimonadaceae bacterium]